MSATRKMNDHAILASISLDRARNVKAATLARHPEAIGSPTIQRIIRSHVADARAHHHTYLRMRRQIAG